MEKVNTKQFYEGMQNWLDDRLVNGLITAQEYRLQKAYCIECEKEAVTRDFLANKNTLIGKFFAFWLRLDNFLADSNPLGIHHFIMRPYYALMAYGQVNDYMHRKNGIILYLAYYG